MEIIDPPNIKDRVQCSLCGSPNVYIFYIVNRINDIKLNVGSECILKFPKIDNRLPEGMTLRQVKNKAAREYNKLRRLETFNQRYPNAKNMLSNWRKEYNNLPIILPTNLHNSIIEIYDRLNQIFDNYIDGKCSNEDLNKFGELISEREALMTQATGFIKKNIHNKFIFTKEIYDWILNHSIHKERLIRIIRDNSSLLNAETISFIYEDNFLNSILEDFKLMILDTRISIEKLEESNIYFKFKDKQRRLECQLYLSKEDFMKYYGSKVMERTPKIEEIEIVSKAKLVASEDNFNEIKEELKQILRGSKFSVYLDLYNMKYGLEFTNIEANIFTDRIDPNTFFNAQKDRIILSGQKSREEICEVISSIKNWRPLSDKVKYDIGNITKKPEDEDFKSREELSEV